MSAIAIPATTAANLAAMSTSPRTASASALASTTATNVRRIDRPGPLWAMAAAPSTETT